MKLLADDEVGQGEGVYFDGGPILIAAQLTELVESRLLCGAQGSQMYEEEKGMQILRHMQSAAAASVPAPLL